MAQRTSPETIEKINELYYELGVKSQVAKVLGISPSTVSKYIIPDYQPKTAEVPSFDKPTILDLNKFNLADVSDLTVMSEEEWKQLKELQKEILV